MAKRNRNAPIQVSGKAYCDWNAFAWINPKPNVLAIGDFVIWTWSGDSETPESSKDGGRFNVSVYDGKDRRKLKVRNTRVHRLLAFTNDRDREEKLRKLIPELQALKGSMLEWNEGGFQVSVMAPPTATEGTSQAGTSGSSNPA